MKKLLPFIIFILVGCQLEQSDPTTSVRYELTGSVSGGSPVTGITVQVMDENQNIIAFAGVSTPWEYSFEVSQTTPSPDPPEHYLEVDALTPSISLTTGTNTAVSDPAPVGPPYTLVDAAATFLSDGILNNKDWFRNETTGQGHRVVTVLDDNNIRISYDMFPVIFHNYTIYKNKTITGTIYSDGEVVRTSTIEGYSIYKIF